MGGQEESLRSWASKKGVSVVSRQEDVSIMSIALKQSRQQVVKYKQARVNVCPLMFRPVARNAATRWGHTHQDNWLLRAAVTSKRHMATILNMPILS